MTTTVLPENAVTLIILGIAFWKSGGKFLILLCILSIIMHAGLDWVLLKELDPESMSGNITYYWVMSLFFLSMFGLFFLQMSKLAVWLAGLMLFQCVISMAMSLNGAVFADVTLPEFELVYLLHSMFNDTIWVVECIIAWIAATSSRE